MFEESNYALSSRSKGYLIPLRTTAETDTSFQTIEAYTVEIPAKFANTVLRAIDEAINPRYPIKLPHLRRFIKPALLPNHLQKSYGEDTSDDFPRKDTLHFLICATKTLNADEVLRLLSSSTRTGAKTHRFHLQTVSVPLLPPTSVDQAEAWTQRYWPTVYKGSNPFGPHSSVITRAENEIIVNVASYIALAKRVGAETATASFGLPIGAVTVNRSNPAHPSIVVAAGDARWADLPDAAKHGSGNVMHHAVMRTIGLIARKRKDMLKAALQDEHMGMKHSGFADEPVLTMERDLLAGATLAAGGYLCLDLEIYVTHEPCIMCSMALLHSRFGKVVFAERMPHTGGLTGEAVGSQASYGLFWRPELNWKLLAWQWVDDERSLSSLSTTQVHV